MNMPEWLTLLGGTFLSTLRDVVPIITIIFGFQFLLLRRAIPQWRRVVLGLVYVVLGLTLFLVGLDQALFPLGRSMAAQLTAPEFLHSAGIAVALHWSDYGWVYLFALMVGFATTVAEPSLLAVAIKAEQESGGAINATGLRVAVALGVAVGISLGCFRIVTGTPLQYYIMAGYGVVILQTMRAPKMIVPLAYDSGGVTTSTVTVPLVAALGLGLAETIPGRSALLDGFGLIAFASLFPIIAVLGYAQLGEWLVARRRKQRLQDEEVVEADKLLEELANRSSGKSGNSGDVTV